jgi:hypothetical protein
MTELEDLQRMAEAMDLVAERPDFPGAIDQADLVPGMRIVRHYRVGNSWQGETYDVVTAPQEKDTESGLPLFCGHGYEVKVRYARDPSRTRDYDVGDLGVAPYETQLGPLWNSGAYCTRESS